MTPRQCRPECRNGCAGPGARWRDRFKLVAGTGTSTKISLVESKTKSGKLALPSVPVYFVDSMISKWLQLCSALVLVSAVAAWASPSGSARIQGMVTDSNKNPVAGAEVHISAKDGSGLQKVIRTDSNGEFGVSNLPVTDYEVVLFVNGQIKASLTNQHVFGNKPTQTDFKLSGKYAANAQKKHTHMVYVPAETGSNLSGRWVEVDENGQADSVGVNNVERAGSEALRRIQSNSGAVGNMTGGGR